MLLDNYGKIVLRLQGTTENVQAEALFSFHYGTCLSVALIKLHFYHELLHSADNDVYILVPKLLTGSRDKKLFGE